MTISVAVITSDMEYITRLISYMKASPIYHTWRLQLYSSPERIHLLTELERAQLIVVEATFLNVLQRRIEAGGGEIVNHVLMTKNGSIPLIVLTEKRSELAEYELCKYQALSSLLHGMQHRLESTFSQHQQIEVTGESPHCIGICSTLEQTGKTLFALHLAALLSNKGYRVFYCNFERWNTSSLYLQGFILKEQASYSDLLYLVKSNQNVKKWLTERVTAISKYGFFMLSPFQHEADRQTLSSQDAQAMLLSIAQSGLYDFIIVDLPAGINQWTLPILNQCAANYMLVLPQHAWQTKHRLALTYAEQHETEYMEKLQLESYIVMNDLYGVELKTVERSYHHIEYLPHVAAWQQGNALLLSSASYRAAVERCIIRILKNEEKARGVCVR